MANLLAALLVVSIGLNLLAAFTVYLLLSYLVSNAFREKLSERFVKALNYRLLGAGVPQDFIDNEEIVENLMTHFWIGKLNLDQAVEAGIRYHKAKGERDLPRV